MEKKVIGIDLGTTFCAMAYVDDEGNVQVLNASGDGTTLPSVVQIKSDGMVVGQAALNQYLIDEEHVIRWIKRAMGNDEYLFPQGFLWDLDASHQDDLDDVDADEDEQESRKNQGRLVSDAMRAAFAEHSVSLSPGASLLRRTPGWRWSVRDADDGYDIQKDGDQLKVYRGLSAVRISAEVLKTLKSMAEAQLGHSVDEVVITCPAYFNAKETANTKRAGELAGLTVREIVKEPVAAAVYYGIDNMVNGEKTMICDLGGGTFDSTILAMEGGVFKPISTVGNRRLGGHDWTEDLVDLVAERAVAELGGDPRNDPRAGQSLYEECEQAKRAFTRLSEKAIPCISKGKVGQVTVTRDDFEARTEHNVLMMVSRCEDSLAKAGLTWNDIDRILLVGGSVRLRRVSEALEQASGRKPVMSKSPDLMVACGAAIMARGHVRARKRVGAVTDKSPGGLRDKAPAGLVEQVEIERPIARSLGTRAWDAKESKMVNMLIIPHGTLAPVSESTENVGVNVDDQEAVMVPVVEFENDDDFDPQHSYRCRCLPAARKGDRIRITFHYDRSGILTAEAHDLKTGRQLVMDAAPYREPTPGISVRPKWTVFLIDVSYSMKGDKLRQAKEALIENAREVIALGADGELFRVGIVSFSSQAKKVCDPTTDVAEIERCVNRMNVEGLTAMDDGIEKAVALVMSAPAGTDRDVVMITDGIPDDARRQSTLDAAEDAKSRGVNLCTVALQGDDVDHDFLRRLTPLFFKIEASKDMTAGLGEVLLKMDEALQRGGLRDGRPGGLQEGV